MKSFNIISAAENFQNHLDYFSLNKIDTSFPGFYDDKNFITLEHHNHKLLNNYASFVMQKAYGQDYLERAEAIIKKSAFVLNNELRKDGRQGACIDTSTVISKILEKEGVWNYIVKGSLTVTFPAEANLSKSYFWSIDSGDYSSAHAWVVAPPFKIIDLTVRQQPYKNKEKDFLPDVILQKETRESSLNLEDIIEPLILKVLKLRYKNNKNNIMKAIMPDVVDFTNFFYPEELSINRVLFKYSPTSITAPDLPFEKIKSLNLNGLYGFEIYEKMIKPHIVF